MMAPLRRAARVAEAIVEATGRAVSWLVVAIVGLVTVDVLSRYLLHRGSVAIQELEWHLFALVFLLGAGYTLKHDGHVRVDLLYRHPRVGDRTRAAVDLAGTVLFLVPFSVLVIVKSWPFVIDAFRFAERSPDPGGLPYRWILKAAIPAGFTLLVLQGFANVVHGIDRLRGRSESVRER